MLFLSLLLFIYLVARPNYLIFISVCYFQVSLNAHVYVATKKKEKMIKFMAPEWVCMGPAFVEFRRRTCLNF
ncbi:hypothetical protein F4775DRAFT_556964 [Biscogniauxia sp. FL1348]|nr:hypothetical protein F4775DRAFT_556964 [Biscogniauxia sp. FL1348]